MNNEALRCLLCKTAKCSAGCPVHTPVPEVMKLYREGKHQEAAEILFRNNPFSAITSQVCDWQKFCYGSCILNAKKIPIQWYKIEQELSIPYLLSAKIEVPQKKNGKKISIIGAGPAGITAAIMLRERGYDVVIYDILDRIGGVLRKGIPDFRLDKMYIDAFERILGEIGVKFIGSTIVGKDIQITDIIAKSDCVIVAAGTWVPRKLNIPGEEGEGIIYALDYLRHPEDFKLGKKVLVIGGGNVTMDASRTAKRLGHDTTIVYRKSYENMPAGIIEVDDARADGVEFMVFEVPVAIRREGNKKFAVLRKCENVHNEEGTIVTRIIEGTDHEVEFDSMIVAISQTADKSILKGIKPGDKVYCAGDYVYGAKTVVEAVVSAQNIVKQIVNEI